jgi:uncharacterized protein (DUF302 family)
LSPIATNLHHWYGRGKACPAPGRTDKVTNMENTGYGLRVSVNAPYEQALTRATAALKEQGFGVLTTIDVQQTLKAKLGREFRKYVILGACNPPLADRALHAELEVGLLLPCNVIVYEADSSTTIVAAMAPLAALGVVGHNPRLAEVAHEADQRLRNALSQLEQAQPEVAAQTMGR